MNGNRTERLRRGASSATSVRTWRRRRSESARIACGTVLGGSRLESTPFLPPTRTAGPHDRGLAARETIGAHLQVLVRDNNVDQALRVLKKRMQREGIFREMKQRRAYEKPSEKKAREKAEAVRRSRKLARKQAQRDGLLPAPKRVLKTAPGRLWRGPTRGRPFPPDTTGAGTVQHGERMSAKLERDFGKSANFV